MARYRTLMVNYQSMVLELGLITAALYFAMSYPLSMLARRLEQQHEVVEASLPGAALGAFFRGLRVFTV